MPQIQEQHIKKLWNLFVQKIKTDWNQKYSTYGNTLETVQAPTKFALAVFADMTVFFKEKGINCKVINYLTLHSYFKQQGFSPQIKTGTLDIFCIYLGYPSLSDFIEKNNNESNSYSAQKIVKPAVQFHKQYLVPVLSTLVLFLILFFAEASFNSSKITSAEKNEIAHLIWAACSLEFSLYQSVPFLKDTTTLEKCFVESGPAAKLIKGYLHNAHRNNRKLRLPDSFFEIVAIDSIKIEGDEASAITHEKWRTIWYNTKTNKNEKMYDVFNRQEYYFRRINGEWKVYLTEYAGKAVAVVD